jgi:hypothetical protein
VSIGIWLALKGFMGVGRVVLYLALENSFCYAIIDKVIKEGTVPVPPGRPFTLR